MWSAEKEIHRDGGPVSGPRSVGRVILMVLAGLVVALVLVGQGIFLVTAMRTGSPFSADGGVVTVPKHGTLTHRLSVLLTDVLGPSDRGVPRFRIESLRRAPGTAKLDNVRITWAINNDVSSGTIGNGAQLDVYTMFRGIFGSHLPVDGVTLRGTYPLRGAAGALRETTVMRVALSRRVALTVAKVGWGSLDAQSLWPLVRRPYVNPEFAPQSTE